MLSMAAISFTLLLLFSVYSEAFVAVPTSSRTTKYKTIQTSNFVFQSNSNNNEEQQQKNEKLRREFLSQILLTTITSSSPLVSTATEPPLLSSSTSSKTCLQDLPPVTKGCVRVFLCRHGQTENNRLRLVQGARINPNLNDTGCQQAKRIGYALSGLRNNKPSIGFHSYLERAKETATLASIICLEEEESEKGEKDEKRKQKSVDNTLGKGYISLKPLESIGEVDFGATIEGQKVAEVQNDMAQVYAKWSMGLIDERLEGGESAREVCVFTLLSHLQHNMVRKLIILSIIVVSHTWTFFILKNRSCNEYLKLFNSFQTWQINNNPIMKASKTPLLLMLQYLPYLTPHSLKF